MIANRQAFLATALAATGLFAAVALPAVASEVQPGGLEARTAPANDRTRTDLTRFLLQPASDPQQFAGHRIAVLAISGASAFELETMHAYFVERGASVDVLTPRPMGTGDLVGLAGQVRPTRTISAIGNDGRTHAVAVTWYVDQANAADYGAVYLPNNLEDNQRLRVDGSTIRFLVGAEAASRPIFAAGDAQRLVPAQSAREIAKIAATDEAFGLPTIIGAISSTLARQGR